MSEAVGIFLGASAVGLIILVVTVGPLLSRRKTCRAEDRAVAEMRAGIGIKRVSVMISFWKI